jgi:RNA recognition motif-containing protein
VTSVKIKKPQSNVSLRDPSSFPCSAYVNFKTEEEAKAAINGLNGICVLAGSKPLKIDFYQRANRFLGGF